MKYPLASSSWDYNEIAEAIEVLKSGKCTMGKIVKEFEEKFAKFVGSKYAVMSNSGSSANLLAIAALTFRKDNPLKRGDEILVPAVSWATTYYPLHQYGLKMKFIDIDKSTLNIDIEQIESSISEKTRAIFAVNLLGNPNDFDKLQEICNKHNLILIEDNCESMGALFNNKQCGTFGIMGTFSSFFSHHICTVEGGITVTNDEELYQIMISLRAHGWTRELPMENHVYNKDGDPFNDMFRFVLPGYNLRPNEIFATIGLQQLDKLPHLLKQRKNNYDKFISEMTKSNLGYTQFMDTRSNPSFFGFTFILKEKDAGKRSVLAKALMDNGIECRPIVAGNFAKNPVIKYMDHEIHGNLENADYIDKNGLFIGNSHLDLTKEIEYFINIVSSVLK